MNLALWIAAGLQAAAYLLAGLHKAAQPREKLLADPQFAWTADYPVPVRVIGVIELLGALGLVLPQATGIAPLLAPLAAVGLAIVQVLAARLHLQRGERKTLPVNAVLLVLAVLVAVGRFAL
ncbi:DoxX family protein [Kitasatospora sp. MAP5-34]|uniref:DoxX family protein n=1 Tax=Kitasatospora sp. MAP5-34 TaxID=3035102 RepID=UPI002476034F|nr:DoxX family protein [Kitasatospora sp. MAP5-34]MDH6577952.1 putative membrane protein [Kitasatospora sp. MAP5-34]